MIQTWSWNAITDESVSKFTSAMFHYVEKNPGHIKQNTQQFNFKSVHV